MGIPKSLSTDLLYARSSVLQLPFSSIVEEAKVARARTKVMLETSGDDCINKANISLDAGRKWKVGEAVGDAKSRLRLQDIAGIANVGKEGLGMLQPSTHCLFSQRLLKPSDKPRTNVHLNQVICPKPKIGLFSF